MFAEIADYPTIDVVVFVDLADFDTAVAAIVAHLKVGLTVAVADNNLTVTVNYADILDQIG